MFPTNPFQFLIDAPADDSFVEVNFPCHAIVHNDFAGFLKAFSWERIADPTVLRCCENFLLFFQNCSAEAAELAKYFDFADWAQPLLTCQDVAYARVHINAANVPLWQGARNR